MPTSTDLEHLLGSTAAKRAFVLGFLGAIGEAVLFVLVAVLVINAMLACVVEFTAFLFVFLSDAWLAVAAWRQLGIS